MRIAIGADHRGAEAYTLVRTLLVQLGHEVRDSGGCRDNTPCEYPDRAYPVAQDVATGAADRGILICGSGIGMCMTANKVKGVRAAQVHDEVSAEMSRRHNDANVLCLPADMLGRRIIERIVKTWLRSQFDGGRHARRLAKIAAIEQGLDPATVVDPPPAEGTGPQSPNHAGPDPAPTV